MMQKNIDVIIMMSLVMLVFCLQPVLAAEAPALLSSWSDLDSAVEVVYDGLTNSLVRFPPGGASYDLSEGYLMFAPGSEIEAATNLFALSPRFEIPVWTLHITETQSMGRVWLYTGEADAPFRTNSVPVDFDPDGWVNDLYGAVPGWLNASEETEWYKDRDRSHLRVTLSLICSNDWPLLEDAWQSALTNSPLVDTNRVAFMEIDFQNGQLLSLQLYTPTNPMPVEIYSATDLSTNGIWSFAGFLNATGPFDWWLVPIAIGGSNGVSPSLLSWSQANEAGEGETPFEPKDIPGDSAAFWERAFFNAARADVDTDGDEISDGREYLVHGTNPALADSDDDGLSDRAELYQYMTDPNLRDCDDDTIPDGWEVSGGMNPFDATDITGDPDNDHLYNLHEYWIDSDPQVADTSNYAIADAMKAVDLNISGLVASAAINIFSVQDHAATNYIRNTNCWAAAYDLTCCSPWNSYSDAFGTGKNRAGTLISPRHVLFAAHYDHITTNDVLRFVDQNNNVIERRLIAKKQHPGYPPGYPDFYPDFTVGLLESDVPTNQISFAKVLPDDYRDSIGSGRFLPSLCLDQEEKALIADLVDVVQTNLIEGVDQILTVFDYPVDSKRLEFSEEIILGDSGNPAFLIMDGQLVLLAVWTYGEAGAGSSVTEFKADLNQLMTDLGGGYQLTEIDLSGFSSLVH